MPTFNLWPVILKAENGLRSFSLTCCTQFRSRPIRIKRYVNGNDTSMPAMQGPKCSIF